MACLEVGCSGGSGCSGGGGRGGGGGRYRGGGGGGGRGGRGGGGAPVPACASLSPSGEMKRETVRWKAEGLSSEGAYTCGEGPGGERSTQSTVCNRGRSSLGRRRCGWRRRERRARGRTHAQYSTTLLGGISTRCDDKMTQGKSLRGRMYTLRPDHVPKLHQREGRRVQA